MFFKLPLHIFLLLSDYFYKIVLCIVFTKPIRKGGLMETQSNNPFSYHSEESDAEHTASSYSEIPVPESASTEDPSLEKKQKSAAATTIANAGRTAKNIIFCAIYVFIGALFLIAGGALTFYTIGHPGEYDSPRIFFGVLGVSLFFVFCGVIIILYGITLVWKKPKS